MSAMWASILLILQNAFAWVNSLVAKQDSQNAQVQQGLTDHENDGANSVAAGDSIDAQNAALDKVQKDLDNPQQVVVVLPKGKA